MNIDEFKKEIEKLGIIYNEEMLEKLEIYKNFLIEYNTHTNLTRIVNEEDIYLKHFYDSLTICKVCDLKSIITLIDIGTGAGFPGMVLKIFFPHLDITLLDSNNKKTKFLYELAKKLQIDVHIINDRVENFSKNHLNSFEIVTSRAVANLRVLTEISLPLVKENGMFIPLKGNIDKELSEAEDTLKIMGGKIIKKENFELYNTSGTRNILVILKDKKSSIDEIRAYDKILKKPLKKNSK